MTRQEITTTNLAEFGSREVRMAKDLFVAWCDQGLPEDFSSDEVTIMMNRNSGNVFLTNSEYEVCMMNGKDLESFYSCPNCGHEGFADECILNDRGCESCFPSSDSVECDEEEEGCTKEEVEAMGFRFVGVEEILSHKRKIKGD